jgi:hypothetical protein
LKGNRTSRLSPEQTVERKQNIKNELVKLSSEKTMKGNRESRLSLEKMFETDLQD